MGNGICEYAGTDECLLRIKSGHKPCRKCPENPNCQEIYNCRYQK